MGVAEQQRVAADGGEQSTQEGPGQDRGLLLIGLFKLGKAAFFFLLGLGAIHLIHKDLSQEVVRWAMALRFEPEGRLVQMLLQRVDLIDVHRLKQIGAGAFAYSGLALTEGIGLLLAKAWAEYLTLILTISFLPWELFELVRRPDWTRFGLLIVNLLVLGYLLWLLKRKKDRLERAGLRPVSSGGFSVQKRNAVGIGPGR